MLDFSFANQYGSKQTVWLNISCIGINVNNWYLGNGQNICGTSVLAQKGDGLGLINKQGRYQIVMCDSGGFNS